MGHPPRSFCLSAFTIVTTNYETSGILAGFPLQVGNVESAENPLFRWSLVVNETTGNVYATNGTLTVSNMEIAGTANLIQPPTFGTTNLGPADAATPRIWVPFTNNGKVFYLPGYQ